MAKKETLNPITAFRKANEARKAVVMKSLKKAQEGIVQDTSAAQTLYKKFKPWEGKANFDNLDPVRNIQQANQEQARQKLATYSPSDILNAYNKKAEEGKKKNGGPVKRKK